MTGARTGHHGLRVPRQAAVLVPVLLSLVAPPARAAAPPALAATTVFTATATSTTRVHVARTASFVVTNSANSPNIDVAAARGRLAGFTLTAVNRTTVDPPTLTVMQAGMCSQPGCRPTAPYSFTEYVSAARGLPRRTLESGSLHVSLPAGDYVVRAVTDGAPVRMTLRLSGLTGATTIPVTRRFGAPLQTGTSTDGVAGVSPLRNVEASHDFASDLGLMMDMIFVTYDPHVRSEWGYCLYRGDAKPPTGYYHPECPGGEYGYWVDFGYPTLHYRAANVGSDIALVGGRWTRGYYSTAAGGASSLTAVTLWVDLI